MWGGPILLEPLSVLVDMSPLSQGLIEGSYDLRFVTLSGNCRGLAVLINIKVWPKIGTPRIMLY